MTKPIAECTFVLTEPIFLEGMRCNQRNTLAKTLKWALLALVLLWLGISVYTVATGGGIGFALSELFVIAVVVVYIAVLLPRSRAKRAWKALEAKGLADAERTIQFFSDHLRMDMPGQQMEMDYSQIAKSLDSRNVLILIGKDRKGIIVKKDSLAGCSCHELLQTITENGGLKL